MPDETVRILIQGQDNLTRPAASASRALGDLERSARGPTAALGNLVTTLGRVGLAAMGIKAIVDSVSALARGMVSGNAQFEQFQVSFTTLLGSAEAARAKLAELEEFAKTTPFTLPGVVTAAQNMLAYGFAADELTDTLRAVSDATSTFGSEAMPRAIRALGQIQTRGKLASQEMLQLTEVGLPAWQMLAEQMGVTTGKLQDMTTKGLVPADVAIKGLIEGMKERFGGLSDAQSKTFNGMLSNLEDWSGQAKRTLMASVFDRLKDQLYNLLQYLNTAEVHAAIEDFGTRIGVAIEKGVTAIDNVKRAWTEMSNAAKLQILTVGVMLLAGGPIVQGLKALVLGLSKAAIAFQWFAASAVGRIAVIGAAFVVLGDYIASEFWKAIFDGLMKFGGVIAKLGDDLSALPGAWGQMGSQIRAAGVRLSMMAAQYREDMGDGMVVTNAVIDGITELANKAVPEAEYAFERLADELSGFANDQLTEFQRQIRLLTALTVEVPFAIGTPDQIRKAIEEQGRLLYGQKAVTSATKEAAGATRGYGDEADITTEKVKSLIFASMSYVDALVQMSPAAMAAAAAVAYLEAEIAAVNLALRANADQLQAAESAMAALQAQLGSLNDQLREQQQILSDLTHPQLVGMRAFSEQIAAVERQLNRLRLAEIGLPSVEDLQREYAETVRTITEGGTTFTVFGISTEEAEAKLQELREQQLAAIMAQYPEMTEEMRAYLSTLPLTEEGLEEILRTLQLTESLSFDEQLQRIREAAEGLARELTFDEAIAGIAQAQANIASLTGQIDLQTAALAAQEGVIASLRAATEALNETLRTLRDQLAQSEAQQKLVNQALQAAYQWYIDDRQKMREMGEEGVAVADKMDRKTATLLAAIQGMVDGTVTMSSQALAAMVTQYQIDMALAIAEVNGLDAAIRNIPTTWSTTWTIHKYWEDTSLTPEQQQGQGGTYLEGYQGGGSFRVGGSGGADSQMVAFRATPGERVTITPPGSGGQSGLAREIARELAAILTRQQGGRTVNQTIITNQRVDAGQSYLSLKAATGV